MNGATPLPGAFYARQFAGLALAALLLLWLDTTGVDTWFARLAFDAAQSRFPLQHDATIEWLNHRLAKYAVFATAAVWLWRGVAERDARRLVQLGAMAAGTLVVAALKARSAHTCPWDLAAYGGSADAFALFAPVPAHPGPGHCFPGGHASAGFALLAAFFYHAPRDAARARRWLAVALAAGLAMGAGQMLRGAHFLSHNLWSGWLVWLVSATVFLCHDLAATGGKKNRRSSGGSPVAPPERRETGSRPVWGEAKSQR
ncbi:membrane-associated PAP2 superfamily phosphatase [Crenobacter luteus]|uniref:phosphatase PAP2 family protein n=1 Tax=Crenobacter luteus TaxID=1452487 RepID=UPI00104528FB|nr:phosphatase PAP2 family protein [Crenobacter luteus]TCP10912.1 membrane-associated PAP2 superfamily phosphatase [Crenobacter luteus]